MQGREGGRCREAEREGGREVGREGGREGSIVRPKKERYKVTILISQVKNGLTRNARV